jgi:hypothetical protein
VRRRGAHRPAATLIASVALVFGSERGRVRQFPLKTMNVED